MQVVARSPRIRICDASSSGYGSRPDCHSSIGGRNGARPLTTRSWPRTRSANSDRSSQSTAARGEDRVSVVTGRGPLSGALLLGGQLPAPSRQISCRHQDAAAAKPSRRSGSTELRVEDLTVAVDPRGIGTLVLRGDVPRRRIDGDPPRDESEGFRSADRATVGVMYLLAIETQAGDTEVHRSIIAATCRLPAAAPGHGWTVGESNGAEAGIPQSER